MKARRDYDVVVVGAGPAGLSAARTIARLGFTTLVLDRLAQPGQLSHPCSAMIAPVPHQATGGPTGTLYFRKLDLAIPASMIVGLPSEQYWLSPGGVTFRTPLGDRPNRPVAVIDKPALLRSLAGAAEMSGAQMRYGVEVTGLLQTNGRVTGVRTASEEIQAEVVLSAEGITRALSRTVLPFTRLSGPEHYGLIAYQELAAPAAGAGQVGQYITLGRRYTSARHAFGMVMVPAPGRLAAYFCLYADGPHHFTDRSARFYLQEYLNDDPRVRDLVAGAQPLGEMISHTLAGGAPAQVTAAGFMGLGDAITPAGYLGILPAIYLGRQAALVAAGALDAGGATAKRLLPYEQIFRRRLLPALDAEYRILTRLADLPDADLDALCQSLSTHHTTLPFSAHARAIEWAAAGRGLPRRPLALTPPCPTPTGLALPALA